MTSVGCAVELACGFIYFGVPPFNQIIIMEDIKNRLKLLETDLKKLEIRLKKGFATGTKKDWEHILHQTRKIEELSISQIAILKLQDKKPT
ncbi:MAG: hypothetical protein ACYSR7_02760 [Planctomycetota bacterium]